jgi:signal peptidase II
LIDIFAAAGALLLLDQWSKRLVQLHLADRSVSCGPVLRIRRIVHPKDIYRRDRYRVMLALIWLAALVSAIILHLDGSWFQSRVGLLGLGLALGGAAGNLLDILRLRCVVDFIDLGWWPIFNLADVAIIAGLALALYN